MGEEKRASLSDRHHRSTRLQAISSVTFRREERLVRAVFLDLLRSGAWKGPFPLLPESSSGLGSFIRGMFASLGGLDLTATGHAMGTDVTAVRPATSGASTTTWRKDLRDFLLLFIPTLAFTLHAYRDYRATAGDRTHAILLWIERGLFIVAAVELVLLAMAVV